MSRVCEIHSICLKTEWCLLRGEEKDRNESDHTSEVFFSLHTRQAVARCDDEGDGKVYVVVDMNSYMYLSLLVLLFLNFLMEHF